MAERRSTLLLECGRWAGNWRTLEQEQEAILRRDAEVKAIEQAQRRVESFDVDADRLPASIGFGEDSLQDRGADAGITRFGVNGDVQDVQAAGLAIQIQASDGAFLDGDDLVRRIGVGGPIAFGLRGELHFDEGVFLDGGPRRLRQLGLPGAEIELEEKGTVRFEHGPENDGHVTCGSG